MIVYSSRIPFVEKKECLWQSLLIESGWYARLCRLEEWRLTGCKYFSAGMAVWPWWIL